MEVVNEMIKEAYDEYIHHLRALVEDARKYAENLYNGGRYEAAARYAKRYRDLHNKLQEAQQKSPIDLIFRREDGISEIFINKMKWYFEEMVNEYHRLWYRFYMEDNEEMKNDALRIKNQINSVGQSAREVLKSVLLPELTNLIDEMINF